ncbi:MAG: phosphotransferase [Gammaproteobacteria bacterium]|nr:phosphotransferase [Gammaproteobacteria bacterium]
MRSNKQITSPVMLSYDMSVSEEEWTAIQHLINSNADPVISKKDTNLYNQAPRYTVIKINQNNFFLIADGRGRDKKTNPHAFFGKGAFARVKGAVQFLKKKGGYQPDDKGYAVKIYNRGHLEDEDTFKDILDEAKYFKQAYGSVGKVIRSNDKSKVYFIMPKLPGITLDQIDYASLSLNQLIQIIMATIFELIRFQDMGIAHGDIKSDNILFDQTSGRAYFIDFGVCSPFYRLSQFQLAELINAFENPLKRYVDDNDLIPAIVDEIFSLVDPHTHKLALNNSSSETLANKLHTIITEMMNHASRKTLEW